MGVGGEQAPKCESQKANNTTEKNRLKNTDRKFRENTTIIIINNYNSFPIKMKNKVKRPYFKESKWKKNIGKKRIGYKSIKVTKIVLKQESLQIGKI